MSSPTTTLGNNLPQHITPPHHGFQLGNIGHIFAGFHVFGPVLHIAEYVVPVGVGFVLLAVFRFVYRLRRGPRYR
jgi:hypothetical protein